MSSEYAIEVTNLGKCYQIYDKPSDRLKQILFRGRRQYYKEFWALSDVSFKVKKGETVGIIGRNGSGKSTLLQMICGTLNPTIGNVTVNGRVAALLELGAGFNPEFTGVENIYMAASLYGLTREEVDQRFDAIAAFADIGDHINQPVKTYSSGMYVRLAFAVIAHVDADILVIDEALAVGDAFFTHKCMRFLRNFMKRGTVFFVSHDTNAIKALCDRVIWLEKGIVKMLGDPKDVSDLYTEAFYESQQGVSEIVKTKSAYKLSANDEIIDQRSKFINSSNLRNDIKLNPFNINAKSFGKRAAEIVDVNFLDKNGDRLNWIVGGEYVVLKIKALMTNSIDSPIIGFSLKDKYGQELFGDNTYLSYQGVRIDCKSGDALIAEFHFFMPRLPIGNYSISVAIATGTQSEHIQHHWIHDAIHFKSESSSVSSGLIGIPMVEILLSSEMS